MQLNLLLEASVEKVIYFNSVFLSMVRIYVQNLS